ncbi:MAG: GGDEF domain-containing protein [Chloroflexi bacterium]|nr:GGDEF domain-containing protein [Chloroflexota bacterium]
MKKTIFKLGRVKGLIVITSISILLTLAITVTIVLILKKYGFDINLVTSIYLATFISLIAAPIIIWILIDLLFKIHLLETQTRKLATLDALTGLLCRRAFIEKVEFLYKLAKREKRAFSIVMVDFDHFKKINDQYGHDAGDKVLAAFDKTIHKISRESDLACRFGGEEFAFFLSNTEQAQALKFSERLHMAIRESSIKYEGVSIQYTVSMGIASYPDSRINNIEGFLKAADKGLYIAKESGRNQTKIYKPTKSIEASKQIYVKEKLRN